MAEGAVRQRVSVVAVVALVGTAAVAVAPALRFGYVGATSKVAMETAQLVIAGVSAVLVHGRIRRSGSRSDLLLLVALGVSASGNLFTVVARALDEEREAFSEYTAWSALAITLVAASAYVSAGFLPGRALERRWRSARRSLALVAATVAGVLAGVALLSNHLPGTVTGEFDVESASRPSLDVGAGMLAVHAVALVLFLGAAAGFARRAEDLDDDPLLGAVAVGLVLAGIARLNFLLYPSIHTNVVHTGDVLRLGFYLVLLSGAVREISAYWRDRTQLAVLDERQRIARDLHDGVMQELSFIRSQVSSFRRQPPEPAVIDFVVTATERALVESRQAVRALTDANPGALDVVVRRTVAEIADRAGLAVRYDLVPGLHGGAAVAEHVRRIAREAVTNAARHSQAEILGVSMRVRSGTLRLAFVDDGVGFDPGAANEGFGLRSMRERAAKMDGRLTIEPAPAGGTRVVVDLPLERRSDDAEVLGDHLDESGSVA